MSTVYRCPEGVRPGTDIAGCGSWNTEAKNEGVGQNRVLVVECLDCSIDFQPALEPHVETREEPADAEISEAS